MSDALTRPLPPDTVVAVLDIGSAKICCLIGRVNADGLIQVIGIGHRMCRGLQSGVVVDRDAAERAIRASVDQAERMAGLTVSQVLVSVNMPELRSDIVEVEIAPRDRRVTESTVDQLIAEARRAVLPHDDPILHSFPAAYGLDGRFATRPPIGLFGDRLGLALHVLRAPAAPLRNLETCVRRAHLDVAGFVAAGYAAGQAVLVADERELGAACIDIGAGITALSVWTGGTMVHLETLDCGGRRLTETVARQLGCPVEAAERIKTLHGVAAEPLCSEREQIAVPDLDPRVQDPRHVPRRALAAALRPPLTELFEALRARLAEAGLDHDASGRVVLTGGAAQLQGIDDLAQAILERPVRIGRPRRVLGLAEAAQTPCFAAAAGLLLHAVEAPEDLFGQSPSRPGQPGRTTPFRAISRWLIDHF
ncbi:MAG: cell division protein FtsA [Rhodothalassiaceae bacterium]